MSNEDKVIWVLKKSEEPLRPGQIAEESGLSKEDTSKAIANLKKEGKINSPVRCKYAPC